MTRENKAGIVVSCSFLCLVGVVLWSKLREQPATDGANGSVSPAMAIGDGVPPPPAPVPEAESGRKKLPPGETPPPADTTQGKVAPPAPAPAPGVSLNAFQFDAARVGNTPPEKGATPAPGGDRNGAGDNKEGTPPTGLSPASAGGVAARPSPAAPPGGKGKNDKKDTAPLARPGGLVFEDSTSPLPGGIPGQQGTKSGGPGGGTGVPPVGALGGSTSTPPGLPGSPATSTPEARGGLPGTPNVKKPEPASSEATPYGAGIPGLSSNGSQGGASMPAPDPVKSGTPDAAAGTKSPGAAGTSTTLGLPPEVGTGGKQAPGAGAPARTDTTGSVTPPANPKGTELGPMGASPTGTAGLPGKEPPPLPKPGPGDVSPTASPLTPTGSTGTSPAIGTVTPPPAPASGLRNDSTIPQGTGTGAAATGGAGIPGLGKDPAPPPAPASVILAPPVAGGTGGKPDDGKRLDPSPAPPADGTPNGAKKLPEWYPPADGKTPPPPAPGGTTGGGTGAATIPSPEGLGIKTDGKADGLTPAGTLTPVPAAPASGPAPATGSGAGASAPAGGAAGSTERLPVIPAPTSPPASSGAAALPARPIPTPDASASAGAGSSASAPPGKLGAVDARPLPGGVTPSVAVTYETVHPTGAADTYASLSKKYYGTPDLAEALRLFNRDNAQVSDSVRNNSGYFHPGDTLYIPPASTLIKRYSSAIKAAAPPGGSGAVQASYDAPPAAPTPAGK